MIKRLGNLLWIESEGWESIDCELGESIGAVANFAAVDREPGHEVYES
jgi:hypothetical protein